MYCLMSNHWHLVLRPRTDEALGRLMGWIGDKHRAFINLGMALLDSRRLPK
jgi:REP element-mobilizing transposase RayT